MLQKEKENLGPGQLIMSFHWQDKSCRRLKCFVIYYISEPVHALDPESHEPSFFIIVFNGQVAGKKGREEKQHTNIGEQKWTV